MTGNDEYKAMCATLAAEHGFQIRNPELQARIQQERTRFAEARAAALKSEPLKQFERYADAVGAERYRVTSVRRASEGRRQTFVLDKRSSGFTPAEVAQRMPEMQRLQLRGEDLYYTPLSAEKHHVLVDGLSPAQLARFLQDGYQPAVVLESSPGQYQAVVTVAKLGTAHDPAVGRLLSEVLNREYGEAMRSGIQPHPAPGYENREGGTGHEVRLVQAERRECAKSLALSRQLDAEQSALPVPEHHAPVLEAPRGSAIDAYQRHYRDVVKRQSPWRQTRLPTILTDRRLKHLGRAASGALP